MSWTCTLVEQEFTPSDAAAITGVSTALQRDWRRRKILAEAEDRRWTRWELDDLIRLSVMKLFSDAGMEVSKTVTIAAMAVLPTLSALAQIPGAVAFEGNYEASEEEMQSIIGGMAPRMTLTTAPFGRFLAAFGPDEFDVCRTPTLDSLERLLDETPHSIVSIVDCQALAALIYERAGRPVIRYVVDAQVPGQDD